MARSKLAALGAVGLGAAAAAAASAFVAGPLAAGAPRAPRVGLFAQAPEAPEAPAAPDAVPDAGPEDAQEGGFSWKWLGAGLAAGLVLATSVAPPSEAYVYKLYGVKEIIGFSPPQGYFDKGQTAYMASWPWLERCSKSKKFNKRYKDQNYKYDQKLKKLAKGSPGAQRYAFMKERMKNEQDAYGNRLCGKNDGRPRVISTGEINERGSVVVPALMFLYIAGWIGWSGRSYLARTRNIKAEINLDVPLALTCMASAFAFPVAAWQEIVNGTLVAADKDIIDTGRASNRQP